jgi:hypothetical protein
VTQEHMAAQKAASDVVREWEGRRSASNVTNVAYANALLEVATKEANTRRIVVEYQSLNLGGRQAALHLAFLMTTQVTIEEAERAIMV